MSWNLGAGLDGRVVLVTGAAGGIGQAVAAAFVAAGARVVATDVDADRLAHTFASSPGPAWIHAADLTDADEREALLDDAAAEGDLYAVVHCAAVLRRRADIREVTEEDWDVQVDTNLKATFFLLRGAAEQMSAAGTAGRLIAFASQGWWTGGFGGSVVYNAAKGGVVTMTRGLARTYADRGITVNTIAPGQVRTEMLLADAAPGLIDRLVELTPMGRLGEPEEMAGTAVFLASEHARFITGSTLNVSGGFLMY